MADINGVDPPPLNDTNYVNKVNNSLNAIDAHDHSSGKGRPVAVDFGAAPSITGVLPVVNGGTGFSTTNTFFSEYQTTNVTGFSGSSGTVTTAFSGKTAGGNATTAGVITAAPNNRVEVRTTAQDTSLSDAQGNLVYGRVTESGGTWTLSLFSVVSGSETAFTLGTATNITIYFREVYNLSTRPTIPASLVSGSGAGGASAILTGTAGGTISVNDIVGLNRSGQVVRVTVATADATTLLGFATSASTVGNPVSVQLSGIIGGFSSLTAGLPVYVSTSAGAVVQVPPNATTEIRAVPVGLAVSATQVLILLPENPNTETVLKDRPINLASLIAQDYLVPVTGSTTTADYWAAYNDGGSTPSIPVDGTGGTPTSGMEIQAATTVELNEVRFVKPASNVQGQGWSAEFQVPAPDRAKVLEISFEYNTETAVAGAFVNGDVHVYLVGVTTGQVIQPSNYILNRSPLDIWNTHKAQFQTTATDLSYRLVFHVAQTTSAAYQIYARRLRVVRQQQYTAPVIINAQSFGAITVTASTTSPTKGTTTVDNISVTREGQFAEIQLNYRHSSAGTAGSGTYLVTLPASLSIDTTVLSLDSSSSSNGRGPKVGDVYVTDNAAISTEFSVVPISTTQFKFLDQQTGLLWDSSFAANFADTILQFSGTIRVPIAGWSGNTTILGAESARVVEATVNRTTSNQTINTSLTQIQMQGVVSDSHAAYNPSTFRYTVPVAGKYRHSVNLSFLGAVGNTTTICRLYKNGAEVRNAYTQEIPNGREGGINVVWEDRAVVGDFYELYAITGGAAITMYSTATIPGGSQWSIARIAGPEAIGAGEKIAARCTASSFAASTTVPINYDVKTFDTHNAVTPSPTAWRFSAPRSDYYTVQICGSTTSATPASMFIYKNGSVDSVLGAHDNASEKPGTGVIFLNAGEFIDIRPGAARTTGSDRQANWVLITSGI